jgi:hypothetical protein
VRSSQCSANTQAPCPNPGTNSTGGPVAGTSGWTPRTSRFTDGGGSDHSSGRITRVVMF